MTSLGPDDPAFAGLVVVIIGGGGVGKGTLAGRLVASDPRLWLSRSWTTRARRDGERSDAYVFVDRDTFMQRVANGGFLEYAEVLGELYGTPTPDPPGGRDVVLEIDVQGAIQVKQRYPEALVILLEPPSREAQAERMRRRGDDSLKIAERLALTDREESQGRELGATVVVNDQLDRAVQEVAGILDRHRRTLPGEPT